MKNIFKKLYQSNYLTTQESEKLFQLIISGKVEDIELSSILTAIHIRGEKTDEIKGAINIFLKNMKFFPRPDYLFSDISGTGGDLNNTINVSTASAFVASACGFKIIKHCNKGVSSKSGSSDLLQKFHININSSPKKSRLCLDRFNICFLFAPKYHEGFKYAKNVRKILKIRTIFNILGPFLNPARPSLIVLGVYNKNMVYPMACLLNQLNYKRGIVVNGNNTDEVTLNGITYVSELIEGKISSYELTPQDFGLSFHCTEKKIIEKSKEENYSLIKAIMKGKGDVFNEELIAVNVAILLKIFGNENLKKNTQLALKKIRSGDVYHNINQISKLLKED